MKQYFFVSLITAFFFFGCAGAFNLDDEEGVPQKAKKTEKSDLSVTLLFDNVLEQLPDLKKRNESIKAEIKKFRETIKAAADLVKKEPKKLSTEVITALENGDDENLKELLASGPLLSDSNEKILAAFEEIEKDLKEVDKQLSAQDKLGADLGKATKKGLPDAEEEKKDGKGRRSNFED